MCQERKCIHCENMKYDCDYDLLLVLEIFQDYSEYVFIRRLSVSGFISTLPNRMPRPGRRESPIRAPCLGSPSPSHPRGQSANSMPGCLMCFVPRGTPRGCRISSPAFTWRRTDHPVARGAGRGAENSVTHFSQPTR